MLLGGGAAAVYFLTGKNKDGPTTPAGTSVGAPQGWKEIGAADGFRVQMPGAPVRNEKGEAVKGTVRSPVRWASITGDGTHEFTAVVFDFGQRALPTDAAGLRRLLNEVDPSVFFFQKVLAEREVSVGGLPGAELEIAHEDAKWGGNDYMVLRLAPSGGKLYVLVLSAARGKMDEKIKGTFFDSFRAAN
ncbi:MAG TPA: hypothetical protein VHR66_22220 [Gemmataceae bacterium]|nr:hypothetical protein [Gemmataceae bacterium]